MLSRCAPVGVDQKRPFAELRKSYGEVGRNITAPFAEARTDHRKHPLPDLGVGPADQELGPQRAQLLGAGVKRFVSDDEFAADAPAAWQQMGKTILLRDRATQVALPNQPQPKRSST